MPPSVSARALIDTGASGTCIDPSIVAALGIVPKGYQPMLTPSTGSKPHSAPQYDVGILLPGGDGYKGWPSVSVLESSLANQGITASCFAAF
ncbi:MAG: aspartyl protease family protein [bacterium]